MLLDQIRQPVQHRTALRSSHFPAPRACFKRCPRRRHCLIDIGGIGLCHLRNDFCCSRINRRKCLARSAVDPLPVDQQLIRTDFHAWFHYSRCCRHVILPIGIVAARPLTTNIVGAPAKRLISSAASWRPRKRAHANERKAGRNPSSPVGAQTCCRRRSLYPCAAGGKKDGRRDSTIPRTPTAEPATELELSLPFHRRSRFL